MAILHRRVVVVWLVLVAATAASLLLSETVHASRMHRYVNVAVIAIAFAKVRFVGLDFMEIREAPRGLRIAFEFWLAAIGSTLIVLCWLQAT